MKAARVPAIHLIDGDQTAPNGSDFPGPLMRLSTECENEIKHGGRAFTV